MSLIPKYFIFDVETGGLPNHNPSLLSLYAILLDKNLSSIDDIELFIKPDNEVYKITAESLSINGIDLVEHDKKALTETEAFNKFDEFLKQNKCFDVDPKVMPVGQNLYLDLFFLRSFYPKWNKCINHRVLDTASIVEFLRMNDLIVLPEGEVGSLREMAKYFNLGYENGHDAKFDTKLTLKVLKEYVKIIQNKL